MCNVYLTGVNRWISTLVISKYMLTSCVEKNKHNNYEIEIIIYSNI